RARAAQVVGGSAEEIVAVAVTRGEPDRTLIPGMVVDAVVRAPYGAYPGECYGRYETDWAHFDGYVADIDRDGLRGVERYIDAFVRASDDHDGFLSAVGRDRVEACVAASRALLAGPFV